MLDAGHPILDAGYWMLYLKVKRKKEIRKSIEFSVPL